MSAGATNGPVDMSIAVVFTATEAALLAFLLGTLTFAQDLQQRFLAAEAQCEAQGAPLFTMTLSPLEQGLVMGGLAPVTCQFSGGLRGKVQSAMVAKLIALGVTAD